MNPISLFVLRAFICYMEYTFQMMLTGPLKIPASLLRQWRHCHWVDLAWWTEKGHKLLMLHQFNSFEPLFCCWCSQACIVAHHTLWIIHLQKCKFQYYHMLTQDMEDIEDRHMDTHTHNGHFRNMGYTKNKILVIRARKQSYFFFNSFFF